MPHPPCHAASDTLPLSRCGSCCVRGLSIRPATLALTHSATILWHTLHVTLSLARCCRSYDVSAQYLKDHPEYFATVLLEQPSFFHAQYMYALQSDQAFARAKNRGHISLTARKPSSWSNSQWVFSMPPASVTLHVMLRLRSLHAICH